VCVYTYLVCN